MGIFFLVLLILFLFVFGLKPVPILNAIDGVLPRLLSKILVLSFAVITFIFGIHSEVFSSYDKYIVNLESQYNWLSPIDIINFPFHQYIINTKGEYPENIIDFSEGLKENYPKRKMVILLDKTGSITNNENEKGKKEIKEELLEYLKGTINGFAEKLDNKKIEIQDLYLLTALEKLTKEDEKEKTHIEVLIYAGTEGKRHCIEKKVDEIFNGDIDEDRKKRDSVILKCLTALTTLNSEQNQQEINKRYTDFHGLANALKQPRFLGDGMKNYDHLSFFILSDFIHEESASRKSIKDVEKAWSGMGNLISQLNLILFDNSKKEETFKYVSTEVKEIFKKNFNHLYFFEFDEYLSNKLSTTEKINVMFSSVHDSKTPKPLLVYHSWNKQEYKFDYKGLVKIIKERRTPELIFGFANRIRPGNYVNPYNYLTIKEKGDDKNLDRIKLYKYQKSKLPGGDEENYEVTFLVDEVESKNFFLEFTYPNIGYTMRHPIIFKPVLSKTACVYLIIMYSLFIITFFHINYFHFRAIARQDKAVITNMYKVPYQIIFFCFLGMAAYLTLNLISNLFILGDNIHYVLIVLIILFVVSGIILINKLQKEEKEENEGEDTSKTSKLVNEKIKPDLQNVY